MTEFLESIAMIGAGTLFYLFMSASKYMMSGNFDINVFYKTNIKPLLYSVGGAFVVSSVYHFLPIFQQFIDKDYDVTSYEGLLLLGTIVGGFVKNIFQHKKEKQVTE